MLSSGQLRGATIHHHPIRCGWRGKSVSPPIEHVAQGSGQLYFCFHPLHRWNLVMSPAITGSSQPRTSAGSFSTEKGTLRMGLDRLYHFLNGVNLVRAQVIYITGRTVLG